MRTGILGMVLPDGEILSLGKLENRLTISKRFHDAEDVQVRVRKETDCIPERNGVFENRSGAKAERER